MMQFYYDIIELLSHIDIEEMPRIYALLVEMFLVDELEGSAE